MGGIESLIKEAIALLEQSTYVVGLTGAGISTPSGIPDFRSGESSLWRLADPMEVASIAGFRRRPQSYYEWARPFTKRIMDAKPNVAHVALAQLEKHGPLKCVVTQNIDMLHAKAGTKNLLEVHGHLREMSCLECVEILDAAPFVERFISTGAVPYCPTCGGVLKPNVVLIGELMPRKVMELASWQAESCDLMLVVGTSLETAPICDLPVMAKRNGARLIIVNLEQTRLDYLADVVIHENVTDVLPELAASFVGAQ